ncbi:MAG: type VI secretion system-associated protein TagF [Desulfobacteraceae bacterium]|jgi:type VI secretion system protein ImpM
MPNEIIPGFFGKLPQVGDFISRRLPPYFVKPWDTWLQESIFHSKEQLGSKWRTCYQSAPKWRFVLGPGLCGKYYAAGIVVPSYDKVGRFFPLTVAIVSESSLSHLIPRAVQWFIQLEIMVDLLMKNKINLKVFDQRLMQQQLPLALFKNKDRIADTLLSPASDPLFFRLELQTYHQVPEAFEYLTTHLLQRHLSTFSIWSTKGRAKSSPTLSIFRGMPPADRFVQFLADPETAVT